METLPARRRACLLRMRENCPFRKLRRQTYDVSAAASSPNGSYWNDTSAPTRIQPIGRVDSESLRVRPADPPEAAADVPMEEAVAPRQNRVDQQNQQNPGGDGMDLDKDIDPETGESRGMTPPTTCQSQLE